MMPGVASLGDRRCLVLGAGGFIGTNLVHRLCADGAQVTGFGRRPRNGAGFGGSWIQAEFNDRGALDAALGDAEFVFHLLGGSDPAASNRNPAGELARAVPDNTALIATAAAHGVARFVFVSSGGTVYGRPQRVPITEDAATDPITAYGLSKLVAEKTLGLFHAVAGLDYRILRVANPYGPFQLPDRAQGIVATIVRRALDGEPVEIWGDGSVVRDYLHIDDVCDALVRAAVVDTDVRVFNIGSGQGTSLNALVAAVSQALDRPIDIVHKPARAADVPVNVLDCSQARRFLEWVPRIELEEGLRDTARWITRLRDLR